jgi:parallel beta-helix repeat protein
MVFCFLGFILSTLSSISTSHGAESHPEIALEGTGLEISHSVRIRPGTYRISDPNGAGVLIVKADNVTIDFNGAELIGCQADISPDKFSGFGIVSGGYNNITVKNARIRGFKVAIHIQGGKDIVVENCDVSHNYAMRLKSTPEREDVSDWLWPHNNDNNEWMTNYGGGMVIEDCARATIRANRGYHSQNGIIFDSTHDSEIYDNDFSFNSGWGLAMWRSNRNKVSHNKFDWCVRGYSHGVYARGQDSAGILVFEQCNDNIFAYNSATHGGDGFFLYAGHQTLRQTGEGGCNRNILYGNDFSHAVANGIEATFSDSNYFIENVLNECTYGVWAGYSYNTWVVGNRISDSLNAGVAIEHGHDNVIEGNSFSRNRIGVHLWWDENKDLLNSEYGRKQNTNSERNLIVRNRFENDQIAISLLHTSKTTIEQNSFLRCRETVKAGDNCPETYIGDSEIDAVISRIDFSMRTREFSPPEVSGSLEAFLPEGARRGRKYMIIDEWGHIAAKRVVKK